MEPEPYWHINRVAPSVIMGFCCLLGIPGNLAVLVVVRQSVVLENFTMRLMLNLALSDLLAVVCLPFVMYNQLREWTLGAELCKLLYFLFHSSLNASVLTVTLLSVQRYVQVLYPRSWARLGCLGEGALLISLWGMAGVIGAPAFFVRDIETPASEAPGGPQSCNSHYRSDAQRVAILLLQTGLGFMVPCCVLVTSYFCLHRRVSQASLLRQQRLTKLVSGILLAFFSCWTPLHFFNLLDLLNVGLKSKAVLDVCETAWDFLIAFTTINSCLNPFLYAFATSGVQRGNAQPVST